MSVIYTIGYEGTDIDQFVATLKAVDVRVLVDVRAVALSRKKGFSKSSLRARLHEEGIAYRHFVELGDPKPGREAAREGRYAEFRKIYRNHLVTESAKESLRSLRDLAISLPSCLLCFERDPRVCHRSIVAEEIKSSELEVFDLFGDNPTRYVHNGAKLARCGPCQGAAAP